MVEKKNKNTLYTTKYLQADGDIELLDEKESKENWGAAWFSDPIEVSMREEEIWFSRIDGRLKLEINKG